MKKVVLWLAALATAFVSPPVGAQTPVGGWDDVRVLDLIKRAQARRSQTLADTGMVDYQADARGYVYFYLDRRDIAERTLVKTDQVALDVYWKAPARSKQRIIGLRDQKSLPTTIRYHLDHLSVVQDNFGDRIRLGDGDEVRDVLHPAAPGAEAAYEFRLADSLSIRLPGASDPVRVYEIQVRPRDPSRPGMIGSVFVDRREGDIVRMAFTFTASSYLDRQLDYINLSLENGLWKGRFWLPTRQQVEIRRQLPELGFPAGGVIRGTMRIGNYRFNQDLPDAIFRGPKVAAVPEEERERFAFEQEIHEELRSEGIGPETELSAVRAQAAELIRARMLSGLPGARIDVARASGILRYNRSEGVAVGAGTRWRPDERRVVGARIGFAFGPSHPLVEVDAAQTIGATRLSAGGYLNVPRDVGIGPAASGVVNTLTAAFAGRDYTDLFYARGVAAGLDRQFAPRWSAGTRLRVEGHRSASLEADGSLFAGSEHFRPVSPIDDGTLIALGLGVSRSAEASAARTWSAALRAELGSLRGAEEPFTFVRPRLELGAVRRWVWADAAIEADGSAGVGLGDLPRQELFLLGGRGTLPGFGFRAFGGDRYALARITGSADLLRPWIRTRLLAASGWTGAGDPGQESLDRWGARTTQRPRVSLGAGVGLFYDILRVDLARGLGAGGRWELVVDARTSFWDFL